MSSGNQYWNGSNGTLFVNDELWDKVKSFECKLTFEFEDIPEGMKTVRSLIGFSLEGTITMRKTDSRAILLIADSYKKGITTDVKIIAKAFNRSTGKTERVAFKGITFDEVMLSKFEERTITETELPFKAEDFEVLQTA
ncbi:phage tail tube protein [Schinkia azotoformans]|uniref:phage tail tube protein n=1 Tax=Schinkia azotoformans TaxID=1454 RepID=UPI002DBBBEAB|nr:phage tail tube protein [Schinkia azotoformans]MEC1757378.1 phage tail tube protein [Schinkia azotoformans]